MKCPPTNLPAQAAEVLKTSSFAAFADLAFQLKCSYETLLLIKPDIERILLRTNPEIRITSLMNASPPGFFVDD